MEEAQGNPNYKPPGQKQNNTWIYVIIIILLLATNIYLFLNKDNNQQKLLVATHKLQLADSSLVQLQSEYNASLVRLDELTGKNTQLDRLLQQKDSELARTKQRIQEILAKNSNISQEEMAEARRLIKSLNVKIKDYEKQVARLQKENTRLTEERDSIVMDNTALQQKIDLAKILHASNIRLKAIDLRRGGRKEKETEKAKRVDLLRITFDIDENRIAESGVKELNICIINPDGELLSNPALGSGSFYTADGTIKQFSLAKNVHLKTEEPVLDINVDWQQSAEYEKGAYFVEIYHQGYLIGKGAVNLR